MVCTPTIKSLTTVLIFARAGKRLERMNSASPYPISLTLTVNKAPVEHK